MPCMLTKSCSMCVIMALLELFACNNYRRNVRIIQSHRAGMGKTLHVERLAAEMKRLNQHHGTDITVTLPLHKKSVNQGEVLQSLKEYISEPGHGIPRIFHLDIAHEV